MRVSERFGIYYSDNVRLRVVHLTKTSYIEAARYPRLTMLGQSLGSIVLAGEALSLHTPDIFFDTTGFAFTYPLAYMMGCDVACYTHYPTISTDMLQAVSERRASHNNNDAVASSSLLSAIKLVYYRAFAYLYSKCGSYTR